MTTVPDDLPRLVRRKGPVAGVCAGVAEHLGVAQRAVRWVFVALTLVGGLGVAAYVLLWAMTPRRENAPEPWSEPGLRPQTFLAGGAALVALGVVMVTGLVGGWAGSLTAGLPFVVVGLGALLAWSQLDRTRGRWEGVLRVGLGAVLAVSGVVVLVVREQGTRIVWDALLAGLAVLGTLANLASGRFGAGIGSTAEGIGYFIGVLLTIAGPLLIAWLLLRRK